MKKLLLICFLLAMFLVITMGVNAKYMWNAGTTQEGTTGFVLIGVLSEIVNTYAGNDIFMSPIAYTKSLVGLKGLDQKEVVSMYASTQQFEQLFYKEGPFSPEIYKWSAPYTQMLWMYDESHFFLIRKEDADKIKSWSDLANRPVFNCMRGTGTYELRKAIFGPEALNIWNTIKDTTFEYSHAADALKLKEVDAIAVFAVGGQIAGWAEEILFRTDCAVLVPTSEELEKITKAYSYLVPITLGPEDFGGNVGITKTIKAPGIGSTYIVDPDVPEEIVYQVVKTAYEHATEMAKTVPQWGQFAKGPYEYNLPYLMKYKKMGVPIHPGVLAYFRELGHDTKLLGLE